MDKKIKLGLFGFGCVGQGLYDVLNHSEVLEASVEKICVKDRTKERKLIAVISLLIKLKFSIETTSMWWLS